MAIYKLKDGRIVGLFGDRDLFDLIRDELGDDIANKIEEDYDIKCLAEQEIVDDYERQLDIKDNEIDELKDTIDSLKEDIEELKKENE